MSAGAMKALIKFVEEYWWLAWIFGGGILAAIGTFFEGVGSWISHFGSVRHKRRLELAKAQRPVKTKAEPLPSVTVCGCTHDLAFHDPSTGKCHGRVGGEAGACPCRQYVGPQPLGHVMPLPVVDLDERKELE